MSRRTPAKRESILEIYMPIGMRILVVLYWVGGLSGIMIGILAINQGFYETFFDIQYLLIGQGVALLSLGSIIFLVAIGMVTGAKWSITIAKRLSAVLVGWAAIGTVLGVYTAYAVTALDSTFVLYGMVAWLLIFGICTGLLGLSYLMTHGVTVRKYSEYVTTETYAPQPYSAEPKRLPATAKRAVIRCLDCGAELKPGTSYCPACGAPQGV
ncbi:MAG: zinc ribbon domain-containing protein [Candidatus Bathyarchaeia archaeon]